MQESDVLRLESSNKDDLKAYEDNLSKNESATSIHNSVNITDKSINHHLGVRNEEKALGESGSAFITEEDPSHVNQFTTFDDEDETKEERSLQEVQSQTSDP